MLLGVNYWKLLEMALFIPPNIFLGVGKHYVFYWRLLGTLGNTLRSYLALSSQKKYFIGFVLLTRIIENIGNICISK